MSSSRSDAIPWLPIPESRLSTRAILVSCSSNASCSLAEGTVCGTDKSLDDCPFSMYADALAEAAPDTGGGLSSSGHEWLLLEARLIPLLRPLTFNPADDPLFWTTPASDGTLEMGCTRWKGEASLNLIAGFCRALALPVPAGSPFANFSEFTWESWTLNLLRSDVSRACCEPGNLSLAVGADRWAPINVPRAACACPSSPRGVRRSAASGLHSFSLTQLCCNSTLPRSNTLWGLLDLLREMPEELVESSSCAPSGFERWVLTCCCVLAFSLSLLVSLSMLASWRWLTFFSELYFASTACEIKRFTFISVLDTKFYKFISIYDNELHWPTEEDLILIQDTFHIDPNQNIHLWLVPFKTLTTTYLPTLSES